MNNKMQDRDIADNAPSEFNTYIPSLDVYTSLARINRSLDDMRRIAELEEEVANLQAKVDVSEPFWTRELERQFQEQMKG